MKITDPILIAFLQTTEKYPEGVSNDQLQSEIPGLSLEGIASSVNFLTANGLVEILRGTSSDSLWYRRTRSAKIDFSTDSATIEMVVRDSGGKPATQNPLLDKMDSDELLVYQVIKNADNKGAWTREIKQKTGLHQNVVTKVIKALEAKQIIKSVKTKNSTRKVFMLFDVEPSLEITGGPWFSENELDVEFIEGLAIACYKFIASRSTASNGNPESLLPVGYSGYATLEQIHTFITVSGITNVEIGISDLEFVVNTLVYDGKIEKVFPMHRSKGTVTQFKLIKGATALGLFENPLAKSPCGVCPLVAQCSLAGPITPLKCQYYAEWIQSFF